MKGKRVLATFISILMVTITMACTLPKNPINDVGQIIPDIAFNNGFVLTGFDSRPEFNQRDIGRIDYGKSGLEPDWRIGQWGCKSNLVSAPHQSENGVDVFRDGSKELKINRETGAYSLNVDASTDGVYDGGDRKDFEPWIHFILEIPQFSKPYTMLKDIDFLQFYLEFTLNKEENHCEKFNPNLHTALFIWYVTIADVNPESPTYLEYFWFGLPIYDFRHDYSPEFAQQDGGKEDATSSFIYNPAGQSFLNRTVEVGQPQMLDKNVLPLVQTAYKTAIERGFLKKNGKQAKYEDLGITLMYIGWELPGTFDVGMDVEKMAIYADKN